MAGQWREEMEIHSLNLNLESHLEDLPSGWPHFFPKTDVYTPFGTVRRPNPVMAGILPDA